MKNDQLDYYKKYNISPENQNIEDLSVHYMRRKKLYRQCGIPEIAFRNAEMLEVGPAGGHNTLAFFHWGCRHVDLVEPNPRGIQDMKLLFSEQKIPVNKYSIFEYMIEEYDTDRKYDIIIAEGFLPYVYNQKAVIDKFKELVNSKGIIVITCVDKVGLFVERIKRLIGIALSQNIVTYEEKVRYLTDIFKPQLQKLRGMSKLPEDWVRDNILNPAVHSGVEFSLSHAIQYFREDFEVLGTSPQMFTDYSWSKDIWYDYKSDYLQQFDQKRLSFLMASIPEVIMPIDEANILTKCFEGIYDIVDEYEKMLELSKISDILQLMSSIEVAIQQRFDEEFVKVFYEIKDVLLCLYRGEKINMENYPHFFAAFGRTQQYISFVKK